MSSTQGRTDIRRASSGGKRVAPRQSGSTTAPRPRRRHRKTLGERLLLLVPAMALLGAIAAAIFFTTAGSSYRLEEETCQYYAGNAYAIPEGSKLVRKDDKTFIRSGSNSWESSSLPIYYRKSQKVVLPESMVYCEPRTAHFLQADYFTELTYQTSGTRAERKKADVSMSSGFLFDGKDLYLFLEPIVLSFNGYNVRLPAMSYVEAVPTGDIMVYNHGAGEFMIEAPKGEVMARIETGDYTISLLGDSVTLYDGTRYLLFTRPELLESVFKD